MRKRWARAWWTWCYWRIARHDKDKRAHCLPYREILCDSRHSIGPAYARFVEEQLAGDVLWPDDRKAWWPTGFSAAGAGDFVGPLSAGQAHW